MGDTRPRRQLIPTAFRPTATYAGSSHRFGATPSRLCAFGAGWYPNAAASSRLRSHSRGISGASDNASFVAKGIVAHSVSAGSLHPDYHQPGDEVDKLDLPHMTKIIRGLFDVTKALVDREAPPVWNAAGEKVLERMTRRRR